MQIVLETYYSICLFLSFISYVHICVLAYFFNLNSQKMKYISDICLPIRKNYYKGLSSRHYIKHFDTSARKDIKYDIYQNPPLKNERGRINTIFLNFKVNCSSTLATECFHAPVLFTLVKNSSEI